MLDRILSTKEPLEKTIPTFKAIIYGGVGVGKSYLAMRIAQTITPKNKQIMYIDYAEGWTAVKNTELEKRTDRFQYDSIGQLQAIAQALSEKAEGFENYGCIVIDEYTSMMQETLQRSTEYMHNKNPKTQTDDIVPEWPAYRRNEILGAKVHETINHIKGVNVIYVGHKKDRVETESQLAYTHPNFNPGYGDLFYQDLQLIGYMEASVKKNEYSRRIQAQPEKRVTAKNRLGLDTFTDPDTLVEACKNFVDFNMQEETPENKENKQTGPVSYQEGE